MITTLTTDPTQAAAVLRRGGTCALPTETVYGLAALSHDADAVDAVFRAKGRPSDNPLIVHLLRVSHVDEVAEMSETGHALLEVFSPGPLTVVLRAKPGLPPAVTAGLATVAVRIPRGREIRDVLRGLGAPIVAPSANRSGRPSPTTWQAVQDDLDGRIDAILQGPPTQIGIESTVVDATGDTPVLLRPGAVSLADLRAVIPSARLADAEDDALRQSPGTRHRHYAPSARVRIVASGQGQPSTRAAWIGLSAPPSGYGSVTVCRDLADYAQRLFHTFRQSDAAGLVQIDAEAVPEDGGLGSALMDRLRRAEAR